MRSFSGDGNPRRRQDLGEPRVGFQDVALELGQLVEHLVDGPLVLGGAGSRLRRSGARLRRSLRPRPELAWTSAPLASGIRLSLRGRWHPGPRAARRSRRPGAFGDRSRSVPWKERGRRPRRPCRRFSARSRPGPDRGRRRCLAGRAAWPTSASVWACLTICSPVRWASVLRLLEQAAHLVGGVSHLLAVLAQEPLALVAGALGLVQHVLQVLFTLVQGVHQRLPGKLGEDRQQHQEDDQVQMARVGSAFSGFGASAVGMLGSRRLFRRRGPRVAAGAWPPLAPRA